MDNKSAKQKTIELYSGTGWKAIFSKIRFWDAPYEEVEKLVPKKGKILDLGCGEGVFANFLALSSKNRRILGIELDKERLAAANRGIKNASFKQGDATSVKIPLVDCIIAFHLFHHLKSFNDQEKLLQKSVNALKPGGRLIVVEVDIKPTFKYLVSWITDHFIVPILFEKKLYTPDIYFRKKAEWESLFEKYGLSCRVISAEKGKPFTHVILECKSD